MNENKKLKKNDSTKCQANNNQFTLVWNNKNVKEKPTNRFPRRARISPLIKALYDRVKTPTVQDCSSEIPQKFVKKMYFYKLQENANESVNEWRIEKPTKFCWGPKQCCGKTLHKSCVEKPWKVWKNHLTKKAWKRISKVERSTKDIRGQPLIQKVRWNKCKMTQPTIMEYEHQRFAKNSK